MHDGQRCLVLLAEGENRTPRISVKQPDAFFLQSSANTDRHESESLAQRVTTRLDRYRYAETQTTTLASSLCCKQLSMATSRALPAVVPQPEP